MATESKDWFVAERSEALASFLLRSRDDLKVNEECKLDDGAHFLVDVHGGTAPFRKLLVIQATGTLSHDTSEWLESTNKFFKDEEKRSPFLPVCLFLFNVRDNSARYAWIAEPLTEEDKAELRFTPPGEFLKLDAAAVNEIVNRVRSWYDVLAQQLLVKGK